jgi:hypothetical protein
MREKQKNYIPEEEDAEATRARLLAFHRRNNSMGRFYEMYQNEGPKCSGEPGCPCAACCRMRGRMADRGGRE